MYVVGFNGYQRLQVIRYLLCIYICILFDLMLLSGKNVSEDLVMYVCMYCLVAYVYQQLKFAGI